MALALVRCRWAKSRTRFAKIDLEEGEGWETVAAARGPLSAGAEGKRILLE